MNDFWTLSDATELVEDGPVTMTKNEFIQKTKSMLSDILNEYSECCGNKPTYDDDSEESVCQRCGGGTQIIQGGEIVDCTSCNGTGISKDRVFKTERFVEFIEHTVMFGPQPFLDLLHCDVVQEPMNWISVEEALPDFGTRVFVLYYPDHPVMEGLVPGVDYRRDTSGLRPSNRAIAALFEYKGFGKNVIYWMPIPEKPKKA